MFFGIFSFTFKVNKSQQVKQNYNIVTCLLFHWLYAFNHWFLWLPTTKIAGCMPDYCRLLMCYVKLIQLCGLSFKKTFKILSIFSFVNITGLLTDQ